MKFSKEDKKEFLNRREILEATKVELKKGFVGLDDIIDEVIGLIEPWYLFPKHQVRPTVVNLWGMTGVGKTQLIKKMFEYLDLKDSLYKFDVGDYASQDNTKLSYSFSEKLKNREKHQIGIVFDEFQLGRTIDESGVELDKSGLRAMWDLLDSGKISILQHSYYGTKIYNLFLKLKGCVDNGGVESKLGLITKNISYHEKYFKIEDEDEDEPVTKKSKKGKGKNKEKEKEKEDLFLPEDFHWYIKDTWETRFITDRELKEFTKTLDHNETLCFLEDTMLRAFKPIEFDYSSSCIFVIGNIDEAYRMAKNFDPDSDADRFYKHSIKITLPQIKDALQKRFRAEQIARLGNSHIIYPAFSSKVYRQLISLELDKVRKEVKNLYELDIKFDKSVNTIIYKEGVFPTQGARPVFTTIKSHVESYIGKIIMSIFECGESIDLVNWKFLRGKYKIELFKKGRLINTKTFQVKLKVESLRRTVGDEMQAHVAIHEAGHAVASIYGANILPTEILSRTANMSEGYCSIDMPSINTKELYEKDIIISLGGYVAEKMIFGEENLGSGTYGDFERASNTALNMVKYFGMLGDYPMFYGHPDNNTNTTFNTESVDEVEMIAKKFIKECEKKCTNILEENKYLLLKIGEHLSTHSRMNSRKVKKFVEDFGKEVDFKDKNNYHTFKDRISKGIECQEKLGCPMKTMKQRYGDKLNTNSKNGEAIIVESKDNKND